jgi:putative membrane protein
LAFRQQLANNGFCVTRFSLTTHAHFWQLACSFYREVDIMNIRAWFTLFAIAALAAFGSASCEKPGVRAARENTNDLTSQKIVSIDDAEFLQMAEKAEIRQTTLSRLALEKSTNEDVREFARHVIRNYQQPLAELTNLMKAKSVAHSAAATEEIQLDAMNRLHRLSGSAFDHEFISLMTAEQQAALANFASAAETAADPDIRNYAKSVVPSLRQDFDTADDLEKKLAAKERR